MHKFLSQIPVTEGWQELIGLAIIVVGTLIAAAVVRIILFTIIGHYTKRTKTDLDDALFAATRKQIYLLIYVFGLSVLFNYLQSIHEESLGAKLFEICDRVIFALGVLVVAFTIVRIAHTFLHWYGRTVASRTESTLDDEFVPLLDRVVKIIVFSLAILIVLDHFHVDVKGLIAVLGVGSLAIALAAQDTIANMIAGFVIMIDRPFRVGDRLRLPDGTVCIVNQIGLRSTRMLTFENTFIISPNAELTKTTIHNLSYPSPEIRVDVKFDIGYQSDIPHARQIMLDEAQHHPKVLKDPKPTFALNKFKDSAIEVALYARVGDVADQFQTNQDLAERILNRFRTEKIEIPLPQRVVHLVDNRQTDRQP